MNAAKVMIMRTGMMILPAILLSAVAIAGEEDQTGNRAAQMTKDAWIHGRLETTYAFNPHLNPFTIETSVQDGVVTLQGSVSSDIDKDLAVEIAKGVDGVSEVRNNLQVDPAADKSSEDGPADADRTFAQWVEDVTATARVKGNLLANANTNGLSIDVDTHHSEVTLEGEVESQEEKLLAEMIARNTNGITGVNNKLKVNEQS